MINGELVRQSQPCVLVQEKGRWVALDPENNNELIKNVSTDFLRQEIQAGRLLVDAGWDAGAA